MEEQNQFIIYETEDAQTEIEVTLQAETVWLNQKQMGMLFHKGVPTINEHIKNIYKEGELEKISTIRKFRIVQLEGKRKVERQVDHYNLDVIISVGYRVKSKRGTQFRIWANKIIKEYLVQGYVINEKHLKEKTEQLDSLKKTVLLLSHVTDQKVLTSDEAEGLIKVITDYTYALDILDQYDYQRLQIKDTRSKPQVKITYQEAQSAILELKIKLGGSDLFGLEKDKSLQSSLKTIYQTFDGKELYPSIEEKAAHLLYFVTKNHSFIDGNKRIAAFIFVWFLRKNNLLYSMDGEKRIPDNALVALTLMIASSKPEEKETMIKVIVNLINAKN